MAEERRADVSQHAPILWLHHRNYIIHIVAATRARDYFVTSIMVKVMVNVDFI